VCAVIKIVLIPPSLFMQMQTGPQVYTLGTVRRKCPRQTLKLLLSVSCLAFNLINFTTNEDFFGELQRAAKGSTQAWALL
jgi:hypothetical protein